MIKKLLLIGTIFLSIFNANGQSPEERLNKTVYNRIEYLFNTQQTDSIYALGSDLFKEKVTVDQFKNVLGYFYQFGKITNSQTADFQNKTAFYNLTIGKKDASLKLAVDSQYKFHYFEILDHKIETEKKDIVKSKVSKTNDLDIFIDSIAQTYIKKANTQSLTIGIIHNNKINTFFYGETIKGDTTSLPLENSLYEIGSLTKVFTSTLLANLVETNIIALDDSISKFLPDSLKQNQELLGITFKQLANHTSGLPRLPNNFEKTLKYNAADPYASYTRKDMFAALKDIKLNAPSGEKYEYSNFGYGLLGELIAIISKKSYSLNLQDIITKPLAMNNTVEKINPKTQKVTKVYNADGTEVPVWNWQAFVGAGGIKSTVTDLLKFTQAQFAMPQSALENAMALTRQFTFYLPPNSDIGLAWHMSMMDDVVQYWHNGGTAGSYSFMGIVPDEKSAVVVLSNAAITVDDISVKILDELVKRK